MDDPLVIPGGDAARAKAPRMAVSLRWQWSDEWTAVDFLWCKSLEFAANPAIPEAVLTWRYGFGALFPGNAARDVIDPFDIVGCFVKIEIAPGDTVDASQTNHIPAWHGRVIEEVDRRHGPVSRGQTTIDDGEQTFVCWGMIAELESCVVDRSYAETVTGTAPILRPIGFNCGPGWPQDDGVKCADNMSPGPGPDGVNLFVLDFNFAVKWSSADIVRYLLMYFSPQSIDGETLQPWELDHAASHIFLETYHPRHRIHGMTMKKILDQLIDRRRGVGYDTWVSDSNTIMVRPFTLVANQLQLESGETVEANGQQISLDLADSLFVQKIEVRASDAATFDQVIVRGAPIGCIMTVSFAGGNLDRDWTDDDLDAYNHAATGEDGYASLSRADKQLRNDNFRNRKNGPKESRLHRVFSWFKLLDGWEAKSDNGEDEDFSEHCVFLQNENYTESWHEQILWNDATEDVWQPGLYFGRELPLYDSEDYSGGRIKNEEVARTLLDTEFIKPIVAIRTNPDETDKSKYVYQQVDLLSSSDSFETEGDGGRAWACRVEMRHGHAGFALAVSGASKQHLLGKGKFVKADDTDDVEPELDYRHLLATVYLPTDQHAEIRYPTDSELQSDPQTFGSRIRRLYIDVHDAHLDYVAPQTVVGIADGKLQRSTYGGVVRNDVDRLAGIAQMAAAWYLQDRKTLTVEYKKIRKTCEVGQLITSIDLGNGPEAVNTVVTRIRYDFDRGTTTIQTASGELDLKAM